MSSVSLHIRCLTELLGTFLLVFLGCGSAIIAGGQIGLLGVALAFGFTLMALAASIGPISGCHLNPAVTLTLLLSRKIDAKSVPGYIISQIIGAIIAGFLLYYIAKGGVNFDIQNGFALNGYGEHSPAHYNLMSCFSIELVLTFVLCYVVTATTRSYFTPGFGALTVGGTLIVLILIGGQVTNASINLARSIGVAVVHGGWALHQIWLFAVAQALAAILAAICACITLPKKS